MKTRILVRRIGLLLASILVVTALWMVGVEGAYARLLSFSTNIVLNVSGGDTSVAVEKENGDLLFRVITTFEGQRVRFPQKIESLLYPTIMIIAWQLFVAFTLGIKRSLSGLKWNFPAFFVFQLLFVLLLTAYYSSSLARYTYDLLTDSFYVIALVIIIIDNVRNPQLFIRPERG
ncbi:MAG: hypothetical protein EA394_00670 [Bacteroidia bacterium]|nr:MAG: hypothetical protein EA394_00670 [Bacteroidia bacterium]